MKEHLKWLRDRGELLVIDREVDPNFEASFILKREDGRRAVLFKNIKGADLPLAGNLITKREHLLKAVGASRDSEAYSKLLHAMSNPTRPEVVEPPEYRVTADLSGLPLLRFYEKDGGPYITSAIFVARDPDLAAQNASIHRVMVVDSGRAAVRIVPRHLYRILKKSEARGEELPVAVVIGSKPAVYVAAASSPPYGVDELHVANTLLGGTLKVFEEPRTGLLVPTDFQVMIVGRLNPWEEEMEGPFTDITGTYDIVRKQPVLEVDAVYVRPEALFYAILPAGMEHKILMGFPREAAIWDSVRRVTPEVKAVRLTPGGCGWLHAVVSIRKQREGEPKNVILAALAAHPSLKLVVVVDDDINVDDPVDIEWAIATRFQPDKDLVVISGVRGSSLDPSADQVSYLTSKWGLDATRPIDRPSERFTKARIPWP